MISTKQKLEFVEKGFIRIPGIAGQKAINVALRAINHSIGNGIDPKKVELFRSTTYCPELLAKDPISNLLYETDAWGIVESLVGQRKIKLEGKGQIALRFPVMKLPGALHPHIDGMYTEHNKIKKGTLFTFTALVGFMLSDVPNRFWGNFTGWPGTHRKLANYFQEHGTGVLRKGQMPRIDYPEPEQILARAGDMILSHYLTAHTVVSNVSPYIRYAVFFRIRHVNHESHGEKVFTDLWQEWSGIQKII